MTWLDRLFLLLTGLVALYALSRFYQAYNRTPKTAYLAYMLSFLVLLVAGVLLIAFGYSLLASPWVVVVTTLIPLGLATGLVYEFKPQWAKAYLAFAVIGFLLIAAAYLGGMTSLGKIVLPIVHSIAGLTIVLLPLLAVSQGLAPAGFAWVAVGGVLIGLGGIALAFLKAGKQFLFFSQQVVYLILAPLLLAMTLAYTWGFLKRLAS
ncbi:MAG: hypothetical protein GXO37_02100 [Chloroflexi bacterium]|nr:hypothetical protein [Chloroflexota bacterium]